MASKVVTERLQNTNVLHIDTTSMTGYHWSAAGLAGLTGLVHLYLYLTAGWLPFLFAGALFLAAIAAMIVIPYGHIARRGLYALGVPFTAGQIVGWYVLDGQLTALAIGDKAVQIALIVFLVYLFAMEHRHRSRR